MDGIKNAWTKNMCKTFTVSALTAHLIGTIE